MRSRFIVVILLETVLPLVARGQSLSGQIGIHDPSTVVQCNNRFYTYGTGGSSLVSDDGFTWRRGTALPRRGLAPDVIHLGDRYYLYIAANIGAQPKAAINLLLNKTLDPDSPDYKWEEGGVVASSDGIEDSNAIDPGVFLDPRDGRLWLVYGSYFGYIRLVELDPKSGKRLHPNDKPVDLAINCEASDMIFHGGWYYLLATHGSCCRGADSGYNIRVGRSRKVTGPFLDHEGLDMIQGGGKLLIGSGGRVIGPGHFGLIDLGDGVQKFSLHYEADLERGGASVLDIRPLLWQDGWPAAGENLRPGAFEVESVRTGTALELAVEGMPVGGRRTRGGPPAPGSGGGMFAGTGSPIPPQDVAEVSKNWPQGKLDTRMANYFVRRSRNGRSQPFLAPGVIQDRRISKLRSPARTVRWPPLRVQNWLCFLRLPGDLNSCGASSSFLMEAGVSCRNRFRIQRNRSPFPLWEAASPHCPNSIQRATNNGGF
jgi:Beta-xylosidase